MSNTKPTGDRAARLAHFGAELRKTRKRRNLTRDGLAQAAGLSPGTVSILEQGYYEPKASTLFALARALRVAPGWLYGKLENSAPTPLLSDDRPLS